MRCITYNKISDISSIMVDEVHERSRSIDMMLNLIAENIDKHPGLRIIICSAMMDVNPLKRLFPNLAFVDLATLATRPRKLVVIHEEEDSAFCVFTVDDCGRNDEQGISIDEKKFHSKVAEKVLMVLRDNRTKDNILVFVPSKVFFRMGCAVLAKVVVQKNLVGVRRMLLEKIKTDGIDNFEIDLLYSGSCYSSQPQNVRRVILSTNVAESSVTLDNIGVVIDTGLVNRFCHNFNTGVDTLKPCIASVSEIEQRAGRAGREANITGFVHRMFTEATE
ncbi:hypothetical protein L596_030685 [Steinernema carpocapsae]|uniref:Helicase C-terminal domain-containing protein n=1 Tax=Steinernema carpocapsae TaxID=34508 RepID=A0A4U5LQ55_STECR|nr:hypothetical protein L596_030685 [Steinernema carpocapsae]